MALNDSDLDGFTVTTQKKPEKAGGVTVSQIPPQLVKYLETEAPKALADKDYELILTVPIKGTEPKPLAKDATAEQKTAHAEAVKAYDEAVSKATSTAKQLALYAAAWGKGQDPKLYIHKVQNRRDMTGNVARLAVDKWEDVPADNRPGRRAGR
jgi:hypothetical protein